MFNSKKENSINAESTHKSIVPMCKYSVVFELKNGKGYTVWYPTVELAEKYFREVKQAVLEHDYIDTSDFLLFKSDISSIRIDRGGGSGKL